METWLTVKDKAEAIVNEVARNSPKGSYWEQYRETAIFEPVTSDRDVLSLCADALNTAEEHADNLREFVAGLESEVAEYQRLSEELSRLKDYGPMDDVRFQRLQKWTDEHGGFTPYRLHEAEFVLAFCEAVLKQNGAQEVSQRKYNIPNSIMAVFSVPLAQGKITITEEKINGFNRFKALGNLEDVLDTLKDKNGKYPCRSSIIHEWLYHEWGKSLVPYSVASIDNVRHLLSCN